MESSQIGIVAGLGAAMAWAASSMVFSRVAVPASAMNLFKNGISTLLLAVILFVFSFQSSGTVVHLEQSAWLYLAASAFVGIFIGDTCYFRSLQILGARRALILTTLTPPFSAYFGWTLLGERPTLLAWLGIVVLLTGVVIVIRERGGSEEAAGHYPGSKFMGVLLGCLGALSQAIGAAWSKQGIQALPGEDTVEATFIRLLAAAVFGAVFGFFSGVLRPWFGYYRRFLKPLIPASLCGTCLGIWCSLVAFKHTDVAIATTLTSMTPIFVLPLVWLILRQRISTPAMLGAIVAVAGVAVLSISTGQ